jgi:hypothetical protein
MACLLLFALSLCLALLGLVLVRIKKIGDRSAGNFCRIGTLLVLLAAFAMQHYAPAQYAMRALDFWSLMVIIGVGCYAVLWASVAYQINRRSHSGFDESYMLSMLYADSQHDGHTILVDKPSEQRKLRQV